MSKDSIEVQEQFFDFCGGKNFLPNFSMESASLLQEIVILARKFIKSKVNSPLSFPRGKLKVKSKIL